MAERLRVEDRPVVDELGKRIVRAARTRTSRAPPSASTSPTDAQPVGDRRPVRRVPAIDRDRQLRPQQQDDGDRREHQVVRRVEPRHQRAELRDAPRRRHAVGHQRLRAARRGAATRSARARCARAGPRAAPRSCSGVSMRVQHAGGTAAARSRRRPAPRTASRTATPARRGRGTPRRRATIGDQRAGGERDAQRRREAHGRRRRPRRQRPGAADRRLRREDGDVLLEVEHRPQLVDRRLPRAHFVGSGAGARSQSASVSSPISVRVVFSSSKSDAGPNRSRSRAYGCPSRNGAPSRPVPAQRPSRRLEAAQVDPLGALRALEALQPLRVDAPRGRRTTATRRAATRARSTPRTNAIHSRTAPASAIASRMLERMKLTRSSAAIRSRHAARRRSYSARGSVTGLGARGSGLSLRQCPASAGPCPECSAGLQACPSSAFASVT